MRRLTIITAFLTSLLMGGEASAQSVEDALQLEDQGLLVDALDAFEELLRTPGNPREDLMVILQHLAVLRYAAEDGEGARDAIERLLSIDADATLPDSAPPSLVDLLDRESRRFAGRSLRAELTLGEPDGGEVSVQVRVIDDLARVVNGVALVQDDEVLDTAGGSGPAYRVYAPRSAVGHGLMVRLLDDNGGVLWEGEVEGGVARDRDERGDDLPATVSRRPRWHRVVAGVLLGAGVASVVAGGVLVGIDGTSTGEQRVVEGIIEERFRTTAAGGWVLVGFGGAAVLGGLIWLLMGLRPAAAEDDEPNDFALELITGW